MKFLLKYIVKNLNGPSETMPPNCVSEGHIVSLDIVIWRSSVNTQNIQVPSNLLVVHTAYYAPTIRIKAIGLIGRYRYEVLVKQLGKIISVVAS